MVSKLKEAIAITIKVPNRERGIANAVIKVAEKDHKKGKIINIAKIIAKIKVSTVAWVAS